VHCGEFGVWDIDLVGKMMLLWALVITRCSMLEGCGSEAIVLLYIYIPLLGFGYQSSSEMEMGLIRWSICSDRSSLIG
jgi:hypothetical protein